MRAAGLLVLLLVPLSSHAGERMTGQAAREPLFVRLSNATPFQGEPVLVEVFPGVPTDNVVAIWKGKEFPMKDEGQGRFLGIIGVDLLEPPGEVGLSFRAARGGEVLHGEASLTVRERAFPVQELTLPKTMTQFDGATLERIARESRRLAERFSRDSSPPSWSFPFLPPVTGFLPKGFGARRIINGEPRSPHAGVDVDLPEGTPVVAIADGTVAFAGEQFFGGNSVVLDHGGGIFSVYYHLREFTVSEGMRVARGDGIGTVGSSGRATGPHLHFSVRAAGGRIDPELLLALPSR